MIMNKYDDDLREMIVRLHLEEGRTLKSLSEEYHVSRASIQNWLKAYNEECR